MAKKAKKTAARKTVPTKKAKSTAAKKKVNVPRKPRQATLPEMEQPKITRIENAARDYADARDERMRLGEEEQRRHTKLLAIMESEGVQVYKHRTGSQVIECKVAAKDATKKVKVRIYDADEEPATEAKPEPEIGGDAEPDLDMSGEGDFGQDGE